MTEKDINRLVRFTDGPRKGLVGTTYLLGTGEKEGFVAVVFERNMRPLAWESPKNLEFVRRVVTFEVVAD